MSTLDSGYLRAQSEPAKPPLLCVLTPKGAPSTPSQHNHVVFAAPSLRFIPEIYGVDSDASI